MVARRTFDPARAVHSFEVMLIEEHCAMCGQPATHAVVEHLSVPVPPMINYLCCEHFIWIVGDCRTYPYAMPTPRTEEP